MTVRSNTKIEEGMKKGSIIIEPFNPEYLSTSSYDVCLGEYYCKEHKPQFLGAFFNIYDPEHVDRLWGKPIAAPFAEDVFGGIPMVNIDDKDRIIMLEPGESILAHTHEFIGGVYEDTTMMKARSSLGRSLINVCQCAGWGDVGYFNRWTMEITNRSPFHRIPLVVGEPVAQIVFLETGTAKGFYSDKGNYQGSANIEELKLTWHPKSMIPRTKRKNRQHEPV